MGDPAMAPPQHYPPRRHPRVATEMVARLDDGGSTKAVTVRDLGGGGLFVATDEPPAVGAAVDVRFRHVSRLECSARGRVVWRAAGGFGVAFDQVTPAMASFARTLVRMPAHLRPLYLAGVADPSLRVEA